MDKVENLLLGVALVAWIVAMVGLVAWLDHRYEIRKRDRR